MQFNMDKVETVIFDMDGVLFDTERVYLNVWTRVCKNYGYKMTKDIYCKVIATGRENVKKVFKKEFGNDIPIEKMYKEKDNALAKEIERKIPLKEGAYEFLTYLRENKYKVALATSASKERMEKQLEQCNIKYLFDEVVCRDDVKETKPNPEIFIKAANKLKVNPENCIVIEDSSAGVKAAYKGNMIPIHVVDLKEADEEIEKYCYKSFNSLIEVKETIF
jgi:beta-phosphoglucomutase